MGVELALPIFYKRQMISRRTLGLAAFGGLTLAACGPPEPAWRRWARWGETDAEVSARSGGLIGVSHPEEPRHLQLDEPQRVSNARIQQDGVWFDARFEFDPATRRLHTVALWLEGAEPCERLLANTLRRHGGPTWLARSRSGGAGGMYGWNDRPGQRAFRLNYRPWANRPCDCILIYEDPARR